MCSSILSSTNQLWGLGLSPPRCGLAYFATSSPSDCWRFLQATLTGRVRGECPGYLERRCLHRLDMDWRRLPWGGSSRMQALAAAGLLIREPRKTSLCISLKLQLKITVQVKKNASMKFCNALARSGFSQESHERTLRFDPVCRCCCSDCVGVSNPAMNWNCSLNRLPLGLVLHEGACLAFSRHPQGQPG